MESNKKILLTTIGIAVLIVVVTGVTFAFFNYTRTGSSNVIKVGRVYFNTNQSDTINLTNLFPIDPTETGIMNDDTKVGTLEIEITGDTDYDEGIEYLVSSVDSNIYTSNGVLVPISLDVTVDSLGTPNTNYFTARDNTNTSIYKKIVGDTLVGDQMLLVGYIVPNTTSGTIEGIDGSITIKAYLDKNNILISDTYDGTESDNMGTPNSMAQGKTVITTNEWNALQNNGVSFKVKVEANEGIWVNGSLEEIMRIKNYSETLNRGIRDNESSEFVSAQTGIDFGAISSDTNGKGIYMRAGTENDDYPIFYYRGEIEDNNVYFANHCWKAVRTTDTGGVKLIYNGDLADIYSDEITNITNNQITIDTNTSGFVYDETDYSWNATIETSGTQEFSFYLPSGKNYNFIVSGISTQTGGGVVSIYKNNYQIYGTGGGGGSSITGSYTEGSYNNEKISITTNFSGSSLSSPTTLKIKITGSINKIGSGCNNSGNNSGINVNGEIMFSIIDSQTPNSMAHVGYMHGTAYEEYSQDDWINDAKFGSDFTWDGTYYKLAGTIENQPDSYHHYSCNSTNSETLCSNLRYVFGISNVTYYIILQNGKDVDDAIKEMQTNISNSKIKNIIDTWYASNASSMASYTYKLEDTIYCNDRSIGDNNDNGWNPNGGDILKAISFGAKNRSSAADENSTLKNKPSLVCPSKNDSFTVNNSNGNRALTYSVALLTLDEAELAGGVVGLSNDTFYLNSNFNYWLMSPGTFSSHVMIFTVLSGNLNYNILPTNKLGLRPVISIKPGMPVVSGTGTVADPYVIG